MVVALTDFGIDGHSLPMAQATKLIQRAKLTPRYDPVLERARMGFRIRTRRSARDLGVAVAKWGGDPDLPPAAAIPSELSFIAQINLARLPARPIALAGLPAGGLLSFFYDLAREPSLYDEETLDVTKRGWRVLWTPASEAVARRELAGVKKLPPCEMTFLPELTLPAIDSSDYAATLGLGVGGVSPAGYSELQRKEDRRYAALRSALDEDMTSACHRFLGHESPLQGDMQLEAELFSRGTTPGNPEAFASLPKEAQAMARRFRLLLQVDSCDELGWAWGDEGRLCFFVPEEDLHARRFDGAIAHVHSH